MARLVPVLLALALGGADWSVIRANGVQVKAPPGWHRVQGVAEDRFSDPRTVLVVGTNGVRARTSRCQIAAYRVQPAGAVVVVVRWRTQASGGGRPPRSREPLKRIVLRKPGFECFNGRGGAAQVTLGGHAYQVNVMVGDRASARIVAQALAVARSFDLSRR